MKQYPSRLKYKKNHKPSASLLKLFDTKNFYPIKGTTVIKASENGSLTYFQMEACRRSIRRKIRRTGHIFIRIFTNYSRTKKPLATRMGKGKGSHSFWECKVKSGQILCEIFCKNSILADYAAKEACKKLPFKANVFSQFY